MTSIERSVVKYVCLLISKQAPLALSCVQVTDCFARFIFLLTFPQGGVDAKPSLHVYGKRNETKQTKTN